MAKATNNAVAYIGASPRREVRTWSGRARGRVADPGQEALAPGSPTAWRTADLFDKLKGRRHQGESDSLGGGGRRDRQSRRYRSHLLNDPTIAYILLMLGFYGLFFELSSPGTVLPGVIGAICLVLGLFALKSFSINYAGLSLMILGVLFFVAELFTPSYGVLTAGGATALVLGRSFSFARALPSRLPRGHTADRPCDGRVLHLRAHDGAPHEEEETRDRTPGAHRRNRRRSNGHPPARQGLRERRALDGGVG
jgi:hypothetical protein